MRPISPQLGTTSGSARGGTPNRSKSSSSQVPLRMSNSIVRAALEASVARSPVRRWMSQASTVPNRARPLIGTLAQTVHVLEQPLDLRRREVGIEDQTGPLADRAARGPPREAHRSGRAVRRSCQTIASMERRAGLGIPDADRLALVGDPDSAQFARSHAGVVERLAGHRVGDRPDLVRVVLHPAWAGECWVELPVAPADQLSSSSKTRHVVPVVPWSMARIMPRPSAHAIAAPRGGQQVPAGRDQIGASVICSPRGGRPARHLDERPLDYVGV